MDQNQREILAPLVDHLLVVLGERDLLEQFQNRWLVLERFDNESEESLRVLLGKIFGSQESLDRCLLQGQLVELLERQEAEANGLSANGREGGKDFDELELDGKLKLTNEAAWK